MKAEQMINHFSHCLLLVLALPLAAMGEPADILKYRFRGEGVTIQVATPPHPCVKIIDRGILSAATSSTTKGAGTPEASFYMAVENVCSNESMLVYGRMEAPDLFMASSGKTIAVRGTMPITAENFATRSKISEQITFDLVLSASSDGRRRRHGSEHIELRDRGFRSTSTFDQREYTNVTATGSFAGTLAGIPVGMGNIGVFLIQTEQDHTMHMQKY
jgi:hypothetical protein